MFLKIYIFAVSAYPCFLKIAVSPYPYPYRRIAYRWYLAEEYEAGPEVGDDVQEDEDVQDVQDAAANDDVVEVPPSIGLGKRRARVVVEKGKKQRTWTALVIQEQVTQIAESTSSYSSKKSSEVTVQEVMDLVLDCGAGYGTDEHYIATELFVKKRSKGHVHDPSN